MDEVVASLGSTSSITPTSLRTLSCHQCMMLLDAQGFSNFHTAFSGHNITGEDLIYVETMEDIVEMNTDMLRIQMRRLLAKVLEWKVNGVRKDDFFPKAEVIPPSEPIVVEERVAESDAQVLEITPKTKKHRPTKTTKTVKPPATTTTKKRKLEHSLISTNQQTTVVSENNPPPNSSNDDDSDDEDDDFEEKVGFCYPELTLNEMIRMMLARRASEMLSLIGKQLSRKTILDKLYKLVKECSWYGASLLECGFLTKLISAIQAKLARNDTDCIFERIRILAHIFNRHSVHVQSMCTIENYHVFISVIKVHPTNTKVISEAMEIINTIVAVTTKKGIDLPIEECTDLLKLYLPQEALTKTTMALFGTVANNPRYSIAVESVIRTLVITVADNLNSDMDIKVTKAFLVLKGIEVYLARDGAQVASKLKSDDLFSLLWKFFLNRTIPSSYKQSQQLLQLVARVLGEMFDECTLIAVEDVRLFLEALLKKNACLKNGEYLNSSLTLIFKLYRTYPTFIQTTKDLNIMSLLNKLEENKEAMKDSKMMRKTLVVIKDFLECVEIQELIAMCDIVVIMKYVVTLLDFKPQRCCILAIFDIVSWIINQNGSQYQTFLQSSNGPYLYFTFIVSVLHNHATYFEKVMDILVIWFPVPPEPLGLMMHGKVFSLLFKSVHSSQSKRHELLSMYISKMSALPNPNLRETLDTILEWIARRVYPEDSLGYLRVICSFINEKRFWCTLVQWNEIFGLGKTRWKADTFPEELPELYSHLLAQLLATKSEETRLYFTSVYEVCGLMDLALCMRFSNDSVVEIPFSLLNNVVSLVTIMCDVETFRGYFNDKKTFDKLDDISKRLQAMLGEVSGDEVTTTKIQAIHSNIADCVKLMTRFEN